MSSFRKNLEIVRRNPAMMQYLIYDELDNKLNSDADEYDVPDATLPFAFAMECGVVEAAMAIDEMESISRTLFPKLALTHEDLYKHMSDVNYIGRFASPARTTFDLLLSHDEILSKAIPYGNEGNKRLVIPRYTEFRAAELVFTMQHPINIDVLNYGGINITYDGNVSSPISNLKTNIVDWQMLLLDKIKIVRLNIPVDQIKLTTVTESLSPATLFSTDYVFEDQFYYARSFIKQNGSQEWVELYTTHSDLTHDPLKLTVTYKVVNNRLKVSIPAIYTNLGLANGSLRTDIYTTKGVLSRELGEYRNDQFSFKLNDIDDDRTYVSPLNTFSLIRPMARNSVNGGSDAIDLDKLRDRVIYNTMGESVIPITKEQLRDSVDRLGYQLVSNVDNITNRQFLATRTLDKPKTLDLISGAGLAISEWIVDINQIATTEHVYDNGKSITLKPSMLYNYINGRVNPLLDSEINNIVNSGSDRIAREANANRYVYSPFHTVMDTNDNTFEVRPYYLDSPKINEKIYVGENASSGMQASISDFEITKTDYGYSLIVELEESENLFKVHPDNVIVQLGYKPQGENIWVSTNSTFLRRIEKASYYEIRIETNHDINRHGELRTTNLTAFNDFQNNFRTGLDVDFELTVILNDLRSANYTNNHLDTLIQTHLLSNRFMVISRERLHVTLGYDLSKLWRRARPVLGPESYRTWDEDVVAYYKEHVYETDSTGNPKLTLKPDGSLEYTILHRKGDVILDKNGSPEILHRKGDVRLDANGNKELITAREIKHEVSMLMVDGIFYLATDDPVLEYKSEIPSTLVSWLSNDIDDLNKRLLEMSELYLYPTNTYGDCRIRIAEEQVITVPIEQSLTVKYYLSNKDFNNPTLRPMLIETAKNVINEHFNKSTIATSDIISRIRQVVGEHVLAIDVLGLGGANNNFDLVTIEDDAVRFTIKKKLVVLSNDDLTVEDDINVVFMVHR